MYVTRKGQLAKSRPWDEILARQLQTFSRKQRLRRSFPDERLRQRRLSGPDEDIRAARAVPFDAVGHVSRSEFDTAWHMDRSNIHAKEITAKHPSARSTGAAAAVRCLPEAAARAAEARPAERDTEGHSGGEKCEGAPTFRGIDQEEIANVADYSPRSSRPKTISTALLEPSDPHAGDCNTINAGFPDSALVTWR
jgi:hypothetical protein